jgi:hypothetical protein
MMNEHTPGPWELVPPVDDQQEYGFNIWADAINDEDATLCHDVYNKADAHLIAAAPDMLAYLKHRAFCGDEQAKSLVMQARGCME